MQERAWRPFSKRDSSDTARRYDGPFDGVPEWLKPSLMTWLVEFFFVHDDVMGEVYPRRDLILRLGRITNHALPVRLDSFGEALLSDAVLMLDATDFALSTLTQDVYYGEPDAVAALRQFLDDSRSVYTVGRNPAGGYELQRRLPDEATAAATAAMSDDDRAAEHLQEAWSKAFGRHADPGGAYDHAVKAVEVVAKGTVSPKDSTATLGKMITALRDGHSKWTCVIDADGAVEKLAAMMDLLWKGHYRHGDETKPIKPTPDAARAAVHLAVTLVQLFRSGAIRRV